MAELVAEVISQKGHFSFKVTGNSMWPFIKGMDTVTLGAVTEKSLQRGDIVGYLHPVSNNFLVHRVIQIRKNRLLIKGDNCPEPDGWLSPERLVGRLIKVRRNDKRPFTGIRAFRRTIGCLSRMNLLRPTLRLIRSVYL